MLFSPAFAALTHFARPVGRAGTRMHNTMPLMTASTFPAWSKSIEAVAQFHGVDRQAGLTTQQVADKRRQYGFNELEKAPGKPMWRLVLEQFDDMMVKVRGTSPSAASQKQAGHSERLSPTIRP